MGRTITNVKRESTGGRAPRRMTAVGRMRQIAVSSSVDLSEAESEDTQSTSTRVSRSQKMSKDVKYEIKVEKEVKSTRSGRRMCPYKSY